MFVSNAPELFVGFFLGSIAYAMQSYLIIVEVALAKQHERQVL